MDELSPTNVHEEFILISRVEFEEITRRQARLERQVERLNKQMAGVNKQLHANVAPLLEILNAAQGAFKVLNVIYRLGKPLVFFGSIGTAIYAWYLKIR